MQRRPRPRGSSSTHHVQVLLQGVALAAVLHHVLLHALRVEDQHGPVHLAALVQVRLAPLHLHLWRGHLGGVVVVVVCGVWCVVMVVVMVVVVVVVVCAGRVQCCLAVHGAGGMQPSHSRATPERVSAQGAGGGAHLVAA
jgi:hypothetical protein